MLEKVKVSGYKVVSKFLGSLWDILLYLFTKTSRIIQPQLCNFMLFISPLSLDFGTCHSEKAEASVM
jgi:hypothetical protein